MNRSLFRLVFFHLPLASVCLFVTSLMLTNQSAAAAAKQAWQPSFPEALVITEFYYNPPGLDEEREWVEIANLSDRSILLPGFGLGDEEQRGGGESMLRFPEGSEIAAGEAVVIAQTSAGFRTLFGANPDFEIKATNADVPDMIADFQWASGQFALANDGDEIILVDDRDNIIDALSYGDRSTFFSPTIPPVVSGQSVERVPAGCDTGSAVDWRPQSIPTPGELTLDGQCAMAPEEDIESRSQLRAIGEIQGAGDVSPLLNQIVTFRGLVSGTLEDQNAAGVIYYTLFVQDIPGLDDGNPATSDAVAVFLGRQPPQYRLGDQVVVTGQVTEYFGLTEIDDNGLLIELESPAQALPEAVPIDMPQDVASAPAYLEALEGMLVSTTGLLPVLGPTHSGCGFAVGATADALRPIRHTGLEAYLPPLSVLNQSDVDCSKLPALKTGDLVAGIVGPLTYHFERYKVVQQNNDSLQVERTEPIRLKEPPQASENFIRVATFNLDNYLVPLLDQEDPSSERPSVEETGIRQRKLAYTISHALGCPELLGVQEVESEALLLELADITADSCEFAYQVTHRDSADGRGIDVAFLSDPRRVSVDSAQLHQACAPLATGVHDSSIRCPPGEEPLFSRPPLEAVLQVDGEPMTIFVNHFKSKRGGEQETTPRRLAQAGHVHDLVQNRLAVDPQEAIIVLGDFNDFNLSPVWQQLQEGGVLYDAMQEVPAQERYSYIFDGLSQLVDGILVSPALVHRIEDTTIAHINADYPNSVALDDSPFGLPFHASDHDPVLLVLRSNSYSAAAATAMAVTLRETPTLTRQPTAVIVKTSTAAPVTIDEMPTAALRPTAVLATAIEASPTSQSVEPQMPEDETGSRQYVVIAGLVVLLLAVAVLWFARRVAG